MTLISQSTVLRISATWIKSLLPLSSFKGLVGISPAGHAMFESSLYTGSISDTELVKRSGFLKQLQHGDEVMAN